MPHIAGAWPCWPVLSHQTVRTVFPYTKHWKEQVYKNNNGVKEGDILTLLLPLGISGKELDTTLLADLTSFGGSRGAVAHKSSVRVTSYTDPKSEYDRANQLVSALETIDKLVGDALDELHKTKKVLTR